MEFGEWMAAEVYKWHNRTPRMRSSYNSKHERHRGGSGPAEEYGAHTIASSAGRTQGGIREVRMEKETRAPDMNGTHKRATKEAGLNHSTREVVKGDECTDTTSSPLKPLVEEK